MRDDSIYMAETNDTPSVSGRRPPPKSWDEYLTGVVAWLDSHWNGDHSCPYCDNSTWTVGRVVALDAVPSWPGESRLFGRSPVVPIICTRCGHIVLFNALWIFYPQDPLPTFSESSDQD
jgi:hypothetical protein